MNFTPVVEIHSSIHDVILVVNSVDIDRIFHHFSSTYIVTRQNKLLSFGCQYLCNRLPGKTHL